MAATLKSITRTLNTLEGLHGKFPNEKQIRASASLLQLALASHLVGLLSATQKNFELEADVVDGLSKKERDMLLSGVYRTEQDGFRYTTAKITTIKTVRERTGCGLLEAKQLVEAYMTKHRMLYGNNVPSYNRPQY